MPIVNQIANNIKIARKKAGYTQNDFSKMLEVSRSSLAQYEAGIYNPSIELIVKASNILSVDIDELVNGEYAKERVKQVPIVSTASCGKSENNVLQDESLKAFVSESIWNKNLYAVIACGDSMATEIYDNDIVIIDPTKQVLSGDIVFYKIDDECAIKIFFDDIDNYLINFIPFNPSNDFKVKTVRKDDEEVISKLVIHKVIHVVSSKEDNRLARLRAIGR